MIHADSRTDTRLKLLGDIIIIIIIIIICYAVFFQYLTSPLNILM